MLTYTNIKKAETDRDALRSLLRALDAPKRSLRRDECGSWQIKARKGHAYTWGPSGGWLLYCDAGTARKWSSIKRRLSFCNVTQNGDIDGCLRLFELPTPDQGTAIRKALGLRRKRTANAAGFPSINFSSDKKGVSGAPASEKRKGDITMHPDAPAQKSRQNPQIVEPEIPQSTLRGRAR
jgi:hypothetical protein